MQRAPVSGAEKDQVEYRSQARADPAEAVLRQHVEAKGEVIKNHRDEIADLIADLLHLTVRRDEGDDAVESSLQVANLDRRDSIVFRVDDFALMTAPRTDS
jgi:hypothetical protein